jgi:RNase adapter protein RapZ
VQVEKAFGGEDNPTLQATVLSFGYKYGLPVDADMVVDVRFLPNPHWVPELRPLTGLDPTVAAYVFESPEAAELVQRYGDVLRLVLPGYVREGKRYLTLAVGCTGGKHRSVALAEEFGRLLRADDVDVHVVHRDLGRE